jgi:exodeoxyribonuclease VII large subunit
MVGAVVRGAGELVGDRPDALSIADLYDEVQGALERVFPKRRQLWVRGEVQHVSAQRAGRGHCYIDLIDPESAGERQAPVLRVKCWQSTWGPLRASLAREGIELQPGMVVVMRGTIDFYRPKAEIGFVLAEIDVTALLGRLAAQRAALLRKLEAEGLYARNRSLRVPDVPVRLGLVASPGSEGCRDFLGQLEASGFGFQVRLLPVAVQGRSAPSAIASALRRFTSIGPDELDVVVVVRGGGSKADLAAFDAESVARAIAVSSVPVWTGIGHTGDQSVADVVANRCCITPTECGRELARRVTEWWEGSVSATVDLVVRRAADALDESERDHHASRTRLCAMANHLLRNQAEHLARRSTAVARCAPRGLDDARARVLMRGARIAPVVEGHLGRIEERLSSWRRLVGAYDVERQLERGYTITLDADGRLVRDAGSLVPGSEILTRFAAGSARSVVRAVESATGGAPGTGRPHEEPRRTVEPQ